VQFVEFPEEGEYVFGRELFDVLAVLAAVATVGHVERLFLWDMSHFVRV